MTRNLRRKLKRDLRQNIVQFLAIFIMCFIALFIYVTFDADLTGVESTLDEYYKETNFADLIVSSEGFTSEDLIAVNSIPSVSKAALRSTINGRIRLKGDEKKIEYNFTEDIDVSGMRLIEGDPFENNGPGIWIDSSFAERQGLTVGEELQLICDGIEFNETLRGIIDNPDHLYFIIDDTYTDPEVGEYAYAFLSPGEYPGKDPVYDHMYVDLKTVDNQMFLTEEDKAAIDSARLRISSLLTKSVMAFVPKEKEAGYNSVYGDMESDKTLSTVFPTLFITIALLGIMTTMTRLVMKQRTVIGTLKALGFSNAAVTIHYLSYSVVVSLMGSISGAFAGWHTLGKYINDSMNKYYWNPHLDMALSWHVAAVILLIAAMSALTNYLSCRKLLSRRASEILRPEPPGVMGAGSLERTPLWKKLSFATRWNLRDINRNRLRTLGGLAGILLCSILLLTAFGANELMKFTETWDFEELTPADYVVGFAQDAGLDTVYDYAKQFKGQMVEIWEAEIFGDDRSAVYNVTVVDEGNLYRFENEKGEYIDLPEYGTGISYKAAKELKLKVGDIIKFKLAGGRNTYTARIEMIYKSPGSQGIAMTRKYYESIGAEFVPNVMYTDMTVPKSYVTDRREIRSVFSKEAYIKSLKARKATMEVEVTYIMTIAVLIGIVVMYNLGVMSFLEKTREIATLKVLGFPTNKIRWILQQQNIIITGIGTAAGLIIGSSLLEFMMGQLDADSDFLYKRMSIVPYALAFMISFVLSLAVNGVISSKVKDIDMVEALKGVE